MTEADDTTHTAKTIDVLVDALETIEAIGCPYSDSLPARGEATKFTCSASPPRRPDGSLSGPCAPCIAHEALTLFRGQ